MVAPTVLGSTGAAAANDQLVGALVVTFAVIGFGEPSRAARWVNVPLGVWLLVAPWVLAGGGTAGRWNDVACGVAIVLLSLRRGPVEERFGGAERIPLADTAAFVFTWSAVIHHRFCFLVIAFFIQQIESGDKSPCSE